MNKKEVKKKGYIEVIKNRRSHQEVYEEFKTTRPALNKTIATQLGEIPSAAIRAKWQIWLYIYIGLISLLALLRLLGVFALIGTGMKPALLLIIGLLTLILPALGIFGAIKYKMELLRSTSIIIVIFTIRSLNKVTYDSSAIIALSLLAIVVLLGFLLPYKMKTPFKTTIVKKEIDGKMITDFDIQFQDDFVMVNDDILDNDL